MPRPSQRSRSKRRVKKKMPGGKTKQTYVARRPKAHKCANCGIELKGISRLMPTKAKNSPRSKKTINRPYGGFLCAKCARDKIKKEARIN